MAVALPPAIVTEPAAPATTIDMEGVQLSGLDGLALQPKAFPTKREVINVIPKHCFVKDTMRSMKYAVLSCAMTLTIGGLAAAFLPLKVGVISRDDPYKYQLILVGLRVSWYIMCTWTGTKKVRV